MGVQTDAVVWILDAAYSCGDIHQLISLIIFNDVDDEGRPTCKILLRMYLNNVG